MRLDPSQNAPGPEGALLNDDEGGYVLIMTALLLIVLMVTAAFTIDVGLFFSRANRVQRAADAAALAGVVYMPTNFTKAREAALDTAARNGYKHGEDDVTVTVSPGSTPRRLNVTVSDASVETIFGKTVRDSISITRSAVGEYVQQIPLGSAYNAIGTGNLTATNDPEGKKYRPDGKPQNFWLAVNGWCTAKEEGDQRLSYADGNRAYIDPYTFSGDFTADYRCPNAPFDPTFARNSEYTQSGYDYIVKVPCNSPTPDDDAAASCPVDQGPATLRTAFDMFDPNYFRKLPVPGWDFPEESPDGSTTAMSEAAYHAADGATSVTTIVTVYKPDATPYYYADDQIAVQWRFETCTDVLNCPVTQTAGANQGPRTAMAGQWFELYRMASSDLPGRWRINVKTVEGEPNSFGYNAFALRAYVPGSTGGQFQICDARNPGEKATCPQVSGDTAMSLKSLGLESGSDSVQAEFFLARLAPAEEFRGKQVSITLWDVGEYAESIELLAPGSSQGEYFTYRTLPPSLETSTGDEIDDEMEKDFQPSTNKLNVAGTDYLDRKGPFNPDVARTAGTGRYNGRKLELRVSIPSDYDDSVDDGWWRIRYTIGADIGGNYSDRTTWTVSLLGDPVHLVHE